MASVITEAFEHLEKQAVKYNSRGSARNAMNARNGTERPRRKNRYKRRSEYPKRRAVPVVVHKFPRGRQMDPDVHLVRGPQIQSRCAP